MLYLKLVFNYFISSLSDNVLALNFRQRFLRHLYFKLMLALIFTLGQSGRILIANSASPRASWYWSIAAYAYDLLLAIKWSSEAVNKKCNLLIKLFTQ